MARDAELPPPRPASSESTALEWLEALAGYVKAVTVYPDANTRVREGLERVVRAVEAARTDERCTPSANVALVFDGGIARVGKIELQPREGSNAAWLRERFERTSLAGLELEPDVRPEDVRGFARELLDQYSRTQLDREFDRLWERDPPRIRLRRRLFDGVFSDLEPPSEAGGNDDEEPRSRGVPLADHLAQDPGVRERMQALEERLRGAREPGDELTELDVLARLVELLPADAFSDERRVRDWATSILDALLAVPGTGDGDGSRAGPMEADAVDARLARLVRLSTQRFFARAAPRVLELGAGEVDSDEAVARRRARDEEITDDLSAFLAEIRGLPPLPAADLSRELESRVEQLAVWLFHFATRGDDEGLVERLCPGLRRLLADPDAERLAILAKYLEPWPDEELDAARRRFERITGVLTRVDLAPLVLRCGALSFEDVERAFPRDFPLLLRAVDLASEVDLGRLEVLCQRLGYDALVGAAPAMRHAGLQDGQLARRVLALERPGLAGLAAAFLECVGEPLHTDAVAYLRAIGSDRAETCLLSVVGDPLHIPQGYVSGLLRLLAHPPGWRDPALARVVGNELRRFVLERATEPEAAERRAYAIRHLGEFPAAGARELLEAIVSGRRWLVAAREPKCVRFAAREALKRL